MPDLREVEIKLDRNWKDKPFDGQLILRYWGKTTNNVKFSIDPDKFAEQWQRLGEWIGERYESE